MDSKIISKGILRAIATVVGISLLLYFSYLIQAVIAYILIAAVLSLIGRPFIFFLRRRLKINNTVAVIITMILMLSFIIGIIISFIPIILEQGKNLSLLKVEELNKNMQVVYNQVSDYFASQGIDILDKFKDLNLTIEFKEIPTILNAILGGLGNFGAGLFSVLFILFFFMKDSHLFKKAITAIIPKNTESRFSDSLEQINDLLSRYFLGLIIQIGILFVLYAIILFSFGISNALIIAFLCALLNLIPYVGPLIGAIIIVILSMTSNLELDFKTQILPTSMWILFCYTIAQIIDNLISQPIIFAKSTKSHPLEIFLIIIICGILFGIIGMMIAVPSYTALKVILKTFLSENKIVKSLTKNI